jgi:fibronectin type 3 domain-containing protein
LAPAPASNDSCTITLTFMPTDFNCAASSVYCTTARSALLVITDNNNNVTNGTQNVPIAGTAEHDVIVTWTASPTPEVTYNVYRSGTLVNCTSPSATSCADTNVSTTVSYCYTVSAVSSAGIVSAPSAQACTPTPVPPP